MKGLNVLGGTKYVLALSCQGRSARVEGGARPRRVSKPAARVNRWCTSPQKEKRGGVPRDDPGPERPKGGY